MPRYVHVLDRANLRGNDPESTPAGVRSRILRHRHEHRLASLAQSASADADTRLAQAHRVTEALRQENDRLVEEARAARAERVVVSPVAIGSEATDPRWRTALSKLVDPGHTRPLTPEESLIAIERAWPERIRVLPAAWKSARSRNAKRFDRPAKVHELLHVLATVYWTTWTDGKGDLDARHVFGADEFAPRESDSITDAGRKRRERRHGGHAFAMERHLKVGTGAGAGSFRIHFDWHPDRRLILVGHCGEHLDF